MSTMLKNYIANQWRDVDAPEHVDVTNPATADVLARVPLSRTSAVDDAAHAAARAFPSWRRTPPTDRVQYLFKLKDRLEDAFERLARTITLECGKTLDESRGEVRRAIENVEVSCGIPMLMQGYNLEDIAPGIDETMIRQPIGVAALVAPFNFPGMIPFWFMPYAVACGDTFIVKPSEKVPMTMALVFELIDEVGFPPGVVNLVHGGREAVDGILEHPTIRAISFVGSSAVARYVYTRATANGKRAQCQGGAKNAVVVLPDADPALTRHSIAESAFGCAGQRCLAGSLAVAVGEARDWFTDAIVEEATTRVMGDGLGEGVQMGPVITPESRARIEGLIGAGINDGARALADGRGARVGGCEDGFFVGPTVLDNVDPRSELATTEVFGPVLGIIHVDTVDDAIALLNPSDYGNMACLFTNSGAAARKFRYEAQTGNIGINLGVAAPMAFFPFSGWKNSFFGDLHGQGRDAVEFFTDKKVVVERWPQA